MISWIPFNWFISFFNISWYSTIFVNKFKIINQSSVASGIRRIEAVSNISVEKFLKEVQKTNIEKNNLHSKQIEELVLKIKDINPEYNFKSSSDNKVLYIKQLNQIFCLNVMIFIYPLQQKYYSWIIPWILKIYF